MKKSLNTISCIYAICINVKQANRVLRQATLITMNTLVTAYGDKIDSDAYEVIVVELSSLIWSVCPELPKMFFSL